MVIYEQPLNERIRTFLRLEHLFDKEDHFLAHISEWDSRASLSLLLDIIDMLARSDIKTELIKAPSSPLGRTSLPNWRLTN